ncbi:hypothetical protein GWI33_011170 [Rhynchophorus ferrugineus]|uniref:Uncharacterized protein n=1 Tax=Rhynchophorus ferrugineus TaxID=354439 RepID=A0A834ID54_RHYFE|nr:hypothetical protein GWI33_011170 [Rhynchophorus ferrugineus]
MIHNYTCSSVFDKRKTHKKKTKERERRIGISLILNHLLNCCFFINVFWQQHLHSTSFNKIKTQKEQNETNERLNNRDAVAQDSVLAYGGPKTIKKQTRITRDTIVDLLLHLTFAQEARFHANAVTIVELVGPWCEVRLRWSGTEKETRRRTDENRGTTWQS